MDDIDRPAEGMQEAVPSQRADGHIGQILMSARLEQGRELADIAAQTRVPMRHLAAIEEGRHEELPALPYTIGFVKNYARAVGLDPNEASAQFRNETHMVTREPRVAMMEPIDERRAPPRGAVFLGLILVGLFILIAMAWGAGWFGGEEAVDAEFDPVVADVAAPVPPPAVVPPAAQPPAATAPEPAVPQGEIVITANASASDGAWMRVMDSETNERLFERVLAPGESFQVPQGRANLILRAGNAGVLDITVGGTAIPKIGAPGSVVGPVTLTPEGLVAFTSAQGEGATTPSE
ncbi:helix-turn-helix domain-containing protein [Pacificimonas sp. ICDLI1SI03]